jgi:hypothetical protein
MNQFELYPKNILKKLFTISVLLFLVGLASAQNMIFTHPGGKETIEELIFVKSKILAGAEPWTSKWNELKTTWAIPGDGTVPSDETGQVNLAKVAYANALAYNYTGTAKYADQAIEILKSWNSIEAYPIADSQAKLICAWISSLLGPAAELIRGYVSAQDMTYIVNMFQTKFYPSLKVPSNWNGNVEATQIEGLFSISVFCEDKALFDHAVSRFEIRFPASVYLTTDGPKAISLPGASWYYPNYSSPNINGLEQETCRDFNHHSQFALAAFLGSAEVAYHQGTDLYKKHQARFIAMMELMAKQLTSRSIQGVCTNGDITTANPHDSFVIGYNHFHYIKGFTMPETELLLPKSRGGSSDFNVFYETLTHYGVSNAVESAIRPTRETGTDSIFKAD